LDAAACSEGMANATKAASDATIIGR